MTATRAISGNNENWLSNNGTIFVKWLVAGHAMGCRMDGILRFRPTRSSRRATRIQVRRRSRRCGMLLPESQTRCSFSCVFWGECFITYAMVHLCNASAYIYIYISFALTIQTTYFQQTYLYTHTHKHYKSSCRRVKNLRMIYSEYICSISRFCVVLIVTSMFT